MFYKIKSKNKKFYKYLIKKKFLICKVLKLHLLNQMKQEEIKVQIRIYN